MRKSAVFLSLLLMAACGGAEDDARSGPGGQAAAAQAPSVADFIGTWNTTVVLEGTANPVPAVLDSSPDGSAWTMNLQGRSPIGMTVSISGDSLVTMSEPYPSILRDGVTVTVRTAGVLRDGDLVGKVLATYHTPDGEELVPGTMRGTRGS
jgi:hypothetical protein